MFLPRLLAVLVCVGAVSGCSSLSTLGMSPAQIASLDQSKCTGYGYKKGTDAFAACMQQLDIDRAADNRARRGRLANALMNMNQPSVTCNTYGTTFGRVANSTTTCR